MTKQFLSLEDAVKIAVREFDIDEVLARQEFEQKCYITDNQYVIGYHDGLYDAIEAIRSKAESDEENYEIINLGNGLFEKRRKQKLR